MLVAGLSVVSGAQVGVAPTVGRWRLGFSADVGSVPNAFVPKCVEGEPVRSAGGTLSAFFRPFRFVVLQSDVGRSAVMSCNYHRVFPPLPPPSFTESARATTYAPDAPGMPLWRSAVRVGIETPQSLPVMRLTVGGGMIFSNGRTPFRTVAVGVGNRSERARFFAELETCMTRAHIQTEYVKLVQVSPTEITTATRFAPGVIHPSWTTLHLGVEVPLRELAAGVRAAFDSPERTM